MGCDFFDVNGVAADNGNRFGIGSLPLLGVEGVEDVGVLLVNDVDEEPISSVLPCILKAFFLKYNANKPI